MKGEDNKSQLLKISRTFQAPKCPFCVDGIETYVCVSAALQAEARVDVGWELLHMVLVPGVSDGGPCGDHKSVERQADFMSRQTNSKQE